LIPIFSASTALAEQFNFSSFTAIELDSDQLPGESIASYVYFYQPNNHEKKSIFEESLTDSEANDVSNWRRDNKTIEACKHEFFCGLLFFEVKNTSNTDISFIVESHIDIQWYTKTKSLERESNFSDSYIKQTNYLANTHKTFIVTIPTNASVQIMGDYFSLGSARIFDVRLWNLSEFYGSRYKRILYDGLLFGLMLGLIFFNLCVFIFSQEKSYLYYSLMELSIVVFVGFTANYDGIFTELSGEYRLAFWGLSGISINIFSTFFTISLLNIKEKDHLLYKLWIYYLWLHVFNVIALALVIFRFFDINILAIGILIALQFIYLGFLKFYTLIKFRASSKIVLPWFVLSIVQGLILTVWVVDEGGPDLLLSVQLMSVVSAVVLSMMLVYRLKMEREHREHAQESLLSQIQLSRDLQSSKTRFVSSISHELRQPLQSILLYIDNLKREFKGNKHQFVTKLESNVENLSDLLSSIMEVSRVDTDSFKPALRKTEIKALLMDLENEFLLVTKEKEIKLVISPSPHYVNTDPVMLGQILRNLLSNAIKYTDKGEITVSTYSEDNMVKVLVKDTGRGISLSQQEKVFEEFYQVKPSDSSTKQGVGLGLSIVRRLTQKLDIELTLNSTPHEGTEIGLSIPLYQEEFASSKIHSYKDNLPGKTNAQYSLNGTSIAVIEDDPHILKGLDKLLRAWNADVRIFTSTTDFMNCIHDGDWSPNLIVADYHLDDGKNALPVLRSFLYGKEIPLIILSGEAEDVVAENINKMELSTHYRFLPKPLVPLTLRAAIQQGLAFVKSDESVTAIN